MNEPTDVPIAHSTPREHPEHVKRFIAELEKIAAQERSERTEKKDPATEFIRLLREGSEPAPPTVPQRRKAPARKPRQ